MNTKVLFLDFDGVLHPSTTFVGKDMGVLAAQGAQALAAQGFFVWRSMLEATLLEAERGCDIAILIAVHSSWRKQPWCTAELIRDCLGPLGHRFQAFTSPSSERCDSIRQLAARVGMDDYLVLDDHDKEFDEEMRSRLVITNPLRGVSEDEVLTVVGRWGCEADPSYRATPVAAP